MKNPSYTLPPSTPHWVRRWLADSPSRRSLLWVIGLCLVTAAAGAWASRWHRSLWITLFFLYPAVVLWLVLRWADRHRVFAAGSRASSDTPTDHSATPPA